MREPPPNQGPPELRPALRIGRYQLVSPIGAGGMGKVWVALDTAAPALRLVAIKTALGEAAAGADREFWAMLADEASLAARISHQNVCSTYELGHEQGVHFLVMEWSDGASLRDLLDASPARRIAPELAAYLVANVAAGLHAAHELADANGHLLGVVHRDVSPQNVLVSMRGHTRLADFGVAKARGQQHKPTETGEVKGKLSYMAPEQITSRVIDRRVDVFALGCVLYEATLGVRPFHGGDAMTTMYKILEQPLPLPRTLDPSFPEELENVLIRALAKDPQARYQSAEELRAGLLTYLASTRRYVADRHVAELLSGALGDQLRARNQAIVASADQLRRGETDPAKIKSPPPPSPTSTLTPEGGVERTIASTNRAEKWSRGAAAAAALVVLVALAGLLFGREARAPETKAAGARLGIATPAAPLPAPAPAPPPAVTPSTPAGPATTSASPIEVAAARASSEPRKVARGSRGEAARAPQAIGSRRPLIKPGGRKLRPIDTSNPFAKR